MKALPGRIASKSGMEALRGLAILPGPRASGATWRATGMAIKIEDGDGEGQHLLPLARTSSPVDLDLINNIMREPYAERFRLILNDLGATVAEWLGSPFRGRGTSFLGEIVAA